MAIVRIPIFCIGIVFGELAYNNTHLSTRVSILLQFLMFIGFLVTAFLVEFYYKNSPILKWEVGLFWYPFILIVPGFCISYAQIMKQKNGWCRFGKFWAYIGVFSLELYLIHVSFNYAIPIGVIYRVPIIIVLSLLLSKFMQLGLRKVKDHFLTSV